MTMYIPKSAEIYMLAVLVNKAQPEDLVMKLYKSDTTPAVSDTVAHYEEATFGGYEAKPLPGPVWEVNELLKYIKAPQQTFASTMAGQFQKIFGYYIVQSMSGRLWWAERFPDGPYTIENNGDLIRVQPYLEFGA